MTATDKADLARRAFDGVSEMKASRSVADLNNAAGALFGDLDLPYFALARFFQADGSADIQVIAGEFEPRWAARYVAQRYGRSSSIAREMLRTSAPYSWSGVIRTRGLEREQARIWDEARDFGLNDGLFTPVRWTDGSYAAVVLGGRDPAVDDPFVRTVAEVLSAYYASEARRLLARGAGSGPALTARQRECLSWVAQGKSSGAIADILGISAQTVEEHVAEACRRLGVRTRVQAAVEACLLGLIAR